jgi:hypothetical protein
MKEYIIKYEPIGLKECYNIYYLIDGEVEGAEYYGASLSNPISFIWLGYTKHPKSL